VEELRANLVEVISMLLEDGEPRLESEFIGIQQIRVAQMDGARLCRFIRDVTSLPSS